MLLYTTTPGHDRQWELQLRQENSLVLINRQVETLKLINLWHGLPPPTPPCDQVKFPFMRLVKPLICWSQIGRHIQDIFSFFFIAYVRVY